MILYKRFVIFVHSLFTGIISWMPPQLLLTIWSANQMAWRIITRKMRTIQKQRKTMNKTKQSLKLNVYLLNIIFIYIYKRNNHVSSICGKDNDILYT